MTHYHYWQESSIQVHMKWEALLPAVQYWGFFGIGETHIALLWSLESDVNPVFRALAVLVCRCNYNTSSAVMEVDEVVG